MKKTFIPREVLLDKLEFDETSSTYLRYKNNRNSKRNGQEAGYFNSDSGYSVRVSGKEIRSQYAIWRILHGEIESKDLITFKDRDSTNINPDNLCKFSMEDRIHYNYMIINSEWCDIVYYKEGFLYWKIPRFSGENLFKLCNVLHERACTFTNTHGYSCIVLKSRKGGYSNVHTAHRIVYELFNGSIPDGYVIDHIDRNRSNNLIDNLRIVPIIGNARNQSRRSTNKTGHNGVWLREENGSKRYVAQVGDNYKKLSKSFSIRLYGEEKALELALAARDKMLNSVNNACENDLSRYTHNHGEVT